MWGSLIKRKLSYSHQGPMQFSSVAQSCQILCDPMNFSTPGLPVHHQLLESTQTQIHCVGDDIQPSHPLSSPFAPALNPSQHQGLFKWVSSPHQVAKVLEIQLQISPSNEHPGSSWFKIGVPPKDAPASLPVWRYEHGWYVFRNGPPLPLTSM